MTVTHLHKPSLDLADKMAEFYAGNPGPLENMFVRSMVFLAAVAAGVCLFVWIHRRRRKASDALAKEIEEDCEKENRMSRL